MQLIAAVALAFIVSLATMQSSANEITVGGFVSFITAMLMLNAPLKRVTSVNEPLQRGLAAAESVFELIDQPGEPDSGTIRIERAKGAIRFEHVSFAYPGAERLALEDIDLAIEPGRDDRARRALRAAARPRSPTWCRVSTTRRADASRSTATTSKTSSSKACAPTSRS